MTLQCRATSNQCWNKAVYVNVEIYKIKQRWINVVYFNVDLSNVKQRRINVVIFNVDFQNVGQRCECDHLKKKNKRRLKYKIIFLSFKEYAGLKILFILFPILRGKCKRIFAEPQKFLKHWICWLTKTALKLSHFLKYLLDFTSTRRQVQAHLSQFWFYLYLLNVLQDRNTTF